MDSHEKLYSALTFNGCTEREGIHDKAGADLWRRSMDLEKK